MGEDGPSGVIAIDFNVSWKRSILQDVIGELKHDHGRGGFGGQRWISNTLKGGWSG
jgi:hypothetical protein